MKLLVRTFKAAATAPNGHRFHAASGVLSTGSDSIILLRVALGWESEDAAQIDSRQTRWCDLAGELRRNELAAIGPYCGQAVYFKHFAPEPKEYSVNRYDFEAWRHWNIVNDHLAKHHFMVDDSYTLVDMSIWAWARVIPFVLGADAWEKLPHVKRLFDEISARPVALRAEALKTKHEYKTVGGDDARKVLFPQNARLAK